MAKALSEIRRLKKLQVVIADASAVKIPIPEGRRGTDWNLAAALGLADDRKKYNMLMVSCIVPLEAIVKLTSTFICIL